MNKTDKLEIDALKKICGHMETTAKKYRAKHDEIVKANMALLESGYYSTEKDIMDAYGYEYITEAEKDTLLSALESGTAEAEADTVWSIAARIIYKDIHAYRKEIAEIKYQAMTPAERKKVDEAREKFAAEQADRRLRLGKTREGTI